MSSLSFGKLSSINFDIKDGSRFNFFGSLKLLIVLNLVKSSFSINLLSKFNVIQFDKIDFFVSQVYFSPKNCG